MKLHTYSIIKIMGEDEDAVRVKLSFRGKVNREWYSVKLRIPKNKLKDHWGGTADANATNYDDDA